jgi:hypothetical protein
MLRLHPDQHAKASGLVHHDSLDGILAQGEIDVIGRTEEVEAMRRRRRQRVVNIFCGGHVEAEGYLGSE